MAPLVYEYIQRERLAKIGVTSSMRDLPAWKGDAFVLISSEFDRLQSEEIKKKSKRGK